MEVGSTVRAAVLDVSKRERLVDLSIKRELVKQFDKENSNSQAQKKVKPHYFYFHKFLFLLFDFLCRSFSTSSTASLVPNLVDCNHCRREKEKPPRT